MAYESNFVVSIVHNNKPLREFNECGTRVCRVPFNSEYKIRLKSKTWKRALAVITIDGTDVLSGGKAVLLSPYQTVDLERFVDDLDAGRKFKFVSVEKGAMTGEVQDPTSAENGWIQVDVYPEVDAPKVYPTSDTGIPICSTKDMGSVCRSRGMSTIFSVAADNGINLSGATMDFMSCSNESFATNTVANTFYTSGAVPTPCSISGGVSEERYRAISDKGATAEGTHSGQQFRLETKSFEVEEKPVSIKILLKGPKSDLQQGVPATVPNTKPVIVSFRDGKYYVYLNGKLVDGITSCQITDGMVHITGRNGLSIQTADYMLDSQ